MNKHFAAYDAGGEIHWLMICQFLVPSFNAETGLNAVEVGPGTDSSTHFISGEQAQPKQPLPLTISKTQIASDGIDECVISNIPAGTTAQWPDGQTDEVTDGEVRFSVDLAGTYTLRFSAIPYLDQEVTIEAVPAT